VTAYIYNDLISCFIDTAFILSANAEHSSTGKVGFYSVESKVSFDSLLVYSISTKSTIPDMPSTNNLLSFWFSDYFNQNSTSWYLYEGQNRTLSPWFYSDNGFIQ